MAAAELVLDQIRLEFFSQNEFRAQSQWTPFRIVERKKDERELESCNTSHSGIYAYAFWHGSERKRKKHQQFTSCLALPYKGLPPMKSLHLLTSLGMPSVFGNFSLMHWAKSTAVLGSMNNG